MPRRLLERWIRLMAMAGIAMTALAFPMFLDQPLMAKVTAGVGRMGEKGPILYWTHLRPFLQASYDTLILKETAGALASLCMLIAYLPWKLIYSPRRQERTGLHLPLILLLALASASIAWAPALRISLQTLEALIPAALFFLLITDLDWGENGRRRWLWLLTCVGAVLCGAAFCQAVPDSPGFPHLRSMYGSLFGRPELDRNVVGSLLGHNTAMSAYALTSILAAMALCVTSRRPVVRVLLALFIILALFAIVAAQSRAIWPLTALLGGGGAWLMTREAGRRLRMRQWLLAVALLLTLALPLAPGIVRRLRDYSPAALLKETRLRILVVTLPAVAESPWLGHGIGSFITIYPRLQADYFAAHPDSRLGQTDKRTPQAHDDYLQLLLELGLAGLALYVAGFTLYVREGWVGRRALASPRDRVQGLAIGLVLAQHSIHGFLDFPAHIAPLSYLFVLALGLWVSLGREARQSFPLTPRTPPRHALVRVLVLVICLIPLAASPAIWARMARENIVATHIVSGSSISKRLWTSPAPRGAEKRWVIDNAEAYFMKAYRLAPTHWEALTNLASLDIQSADDYVSAVRKLQASDSSSTKAATLRGVAEIGLNRALRLLEASFQEVKYHENTFLAARAWMELDELGGRGRHEAEILKLLNESVRYSGYYYGALKALADILSQPGRETDRARWIDLHHRMREAQPVRYRAEYLVPARDHSLRLDFDLACDPLAQILKANPDLPDLRYEYIRALSESGRPAEAGAELARFEKDLGRNGHYWMALTHSKITQGRFDEALEAAMKGLADEKPANVWLAMAASALLEKTGRISDSVARWNSDIAGSSLEPLLRYERAYMEYSWLKAPSAARRDAKSLTGRNPCPVPMAYYLLGAVEFDAGDYAAAAQNASRALAAYPDSVRAQALRRAAEERQRSASAPAGAASNPATAATPTG